MTTKQQLIERLSGVRVHELIRMRRTTGKSWQVIADEIRDTTGVFVSRETLRRWE